MKYDLKIGDVVLVQENGYGLATLDKGKYVEIVGEADYYGNEGYSVRPYECDLLTKPDSKGSWTVGPETFLGEDLDTPATILLNTVDDEMPEIVHDAVNKPKHNHYFKDCPYDKIDVYRVLEMFDVMDACIQHATKKLLVAGGRGHKDIGRDIQDAIDTLERWKEMRKEEE